MSREKLLTSLFFNLFHSTPDLVTHAPGRVNLIGDHTDYNDGFVLPAAINFGTDIGASRRNDKKIRIYAHDCDRKITEFSLDSIQYNESSMWINYVLGTLKILMESYPDIQGADLVVSGNVPQGAGLSSSASFEIAILKTFSLLYDLDIAGIQAALIAQKAENSFVGCNCGIMDQLISAMGKKGHAMLLDCRNLTYRDAPIPGGYSLFIVNSNVKRGLVDSEYNLRRQQCEQVAAHFDKKALRDVTLSMLDDAKSVLEPVLYRRAKHVISESARAEAALDALQNEDMQSLGLLMKDSHLSLRHNFEVTTSEMDGLVKIIDSVLGLQGGVRMTGGGFGGCVVAITPTELVPSLQSSVEQRYKLNFGLAPDVYICSAEQGAFRE